MIQNAYYVLIHIMEIATLANQGIVYHHMERVYLQITQRIAMIQIVKRVQINI